MFSLHLQLLFAVIFSGASATVVWRNYDGFAVDIKTCSYDIEYELSLADCQQRCTDAATDDTRCKGVLYFDRLRLDVPNDPTRCYLLHKICALNLWDSSTAVTAFWYEDLTSSTTSISSSALSGITCVNYPSSWADSFADTCAQYEAGNFCDGADGDKSHLLGAATNGLNAFQTCCDCAGSVYQTRIGLFEPSWKSNLIDSIDANLVCQTYAPLQVDANEIHAALPQKWSVTDFFSLCNFDTAKLGEKYNILYFLSASKSTTDADFELLRNFRCLDDLIENTHTITVNVCDTFDYALYPYLIDVGSMSSSNLMHVYVNGLFFDTADFVENFNAPHITLQHTAQCNIASLLEGNTQSNLISSLLCEQQTLPPTSDPTMMPSADPTSEPTREPVFTPYPTNAPSQSPSQYPTNAPTLSPTGAPSTSPTVTPTEPPTPLVTSLSYLELGCFVSYASSYSNYDYDAGLLASIEQCQDSCFWYETTYLGATDAHMFFGIQTRDGRCLCYQNWFDITEHGASTACDDEIDDTSSTNVMRVYKTVTLYNNNTREPDNANLDNYYWTYMACYYDGTLSVFEVHTGYRGSIDTCYSTCNQYPLSDYDDSGAYVSYYYGYRYFGQQAGGDCFCSDSVSDITQFGESNDCWYGGQGGTTTTDVYRINNAIGLYPTPSPTTPYPTYGPRSDTADEEEGSSVVGTVLGVIFSICCCCGIIYCIGKSCAD